MATIKKIAERVINQAIGNASTKYYDGWSETIGYKKANRFEVKELEAAAKENGVNRIDTSDGFQIVLTDTALDIEYWLVYERAHYKGKSDIIRAYITNGVSIANS